MSSFKVLPPYSDLGTDYYGNLLLDADLAYTNTDDDMSQLGTFQSLQTLVEVSSLMSGSDGLVWEQQEGVRSLQMALNSQPAVILSSWDTGDPVGLPKLEGGDLGSLERSCPPIPRPTILPQRSVAAYSSPIQQQQQQQQQQLGEGHSRVHYVNLDGEVTAPVAGKRQRVKGREKICGETGEPRPCRVCGEKAGKHSYYGGQVCPSCRAFFRRSVQSGYNATYFCVKDGSCEVNLKTRKNCQYCRYKLCENAGMKTTWVLTDEERKQKFEGRGKRKSSSGCDSVVDEKEEQAITTGGKSHNMTEKEVFKVEEVLKASDYWQQSKVHDMDTGLIRQVIRMVAFRASLTDSGQEQLKSLLKERSLRFANGLKEFQCLCSSDQAEILAGNVPAMMALTSCSFFHPGLEWTGQLAPLLGQGEVDKLDVKLRSLKVSGLDQLKLTYKQFFSTPFLQTEQSEIEFRDLLAGIGCWSQDENEFVLVSLILLFCPDSLDLTERTRVEDTQLVFATLLQKYLINRHRLEPDMARARFTSGMELVSKCKELVALTTENMIHLDNF